MATLRELIIKISANSSSFQTEISRASRMGADYYKTMEQGGKKASAATRQTQRALSELNAQLASVKQSAIGMAGAFAGAFATQQLIHYADTWNQLNGRLRLASTSAGDFSTAQRTLMDISQRTGTSIEANTNLYSRIASSLRDAGYASSDVAKVTETVATSLKLSGASTEEASSVITQLSQALGSGVLRGEEFNAIMENGGRLAKLLASGLGTTVGGLRTMANAGKLTTDKIIPILTNVEQLRKEFDTLPASISGSAQKVQNALMAWVGGTNDTLGASSALAGVLDGLAMHIDGAANAMAVLVGIGAARYFGNLVSGAVSSTQSMVSAKLEAVSLADAQVYAARQMQRKAIANAEAAQSDYNLALAEANVAKNTDASMLATQNLIKKRSEMIAANANLVQSNRAVSASQQSLDKATSTVGLMKSGVGSLLSVLGGLPGVLMLGVGTWYTMYQNQEQARKSAQEYAQEIDNIREKTQAMRLPEASDNEGKARAALAEQNRQIAEQAERVAALTRDIETLNRARENPSYQGNVNDADLVNGLEKATAALAVEQSRLAEMQDKSKDIQSVLEGIEYRRIDLIRQQAAEQNSSYQSLLVMNGQHAEFNRLLSLGNTLLMSRQGMVNAPMRIPQATVNDKDQQSLVQKQQAAELAGLVGLAKVRKQAEFDLQKMGRTGAENAAYAAQYTQALEDEYTNSQKVSQAKKDSTKATNAQNKAERSAAQTAEQYSRKIADLSVAVDVQKVRAQQGEKAAELYAASHENGTKWTDEQRKSIEASAVELAKWTQKADTAVKKQQEMTDALKDLRDAARKYQDDSALTLKTSGMSDRQREQYGERQQIWRVFSKTDKGTEAVAARQTALDALAKKYADAKAAEEDWQAGVSGGLADWVDNASNYAEQAAGATKGAMDGMVSNITEMLNGNKASWRDWAVDVLKSIEKVLLNAAIVNSLKSLGGSLSGAGGLLGTISGALLGSVGGASAGAGAGISAGAGAMGMATGWQSYLPHAKGGTYASASLSAYSNGIYNTPQTFAFAKGAGVFAEAGPEAIMPLTRGPDGSLGVKAVGQSGGAGGGFVYSPVNNIQIQNDGQNGQIGPEALKAVYAIARKSAEDFFKQQMRDGGMLAGGR